jgi:pyruvate dehydrogenase E2 component (dihydrolipoamide acetyltransferase)
MLKEVRLPVLGENVETAEVLQVLVGAGDTVEKNQALVELETDKATVEVPAPFGGVVREIRVRRGDAVTVGQTIVTLEVGGGEVAAAKAAGAPAADAPAAEAGEEGEPAAPARMHRDAPARRQAERAPARDAAATAGPREAGEPAPAAPSVRRLAREIGVDIDDVAGSGPGGRISVEDVKRQARDLITTRRRAPAAGGAAVPPLPDFAKWGEIERAPMSGIRRQTAAAMSRSWAIVPHVTQYDRADVTELEGERRQLAPRVEEAGGKLTVTALVLKVVAGALRAFPKFNASVDIEREEIVYKRYVHIGVAVDTEHGLLVPVLRDVDLRTLTEIAVELSVLSRKARSRKVSLEELGGATFTVTNLGGLGTTYFAPLVHWPQGAVLGVGRAATEAVWRDERFEPRLVLPLSVSYDHRLIDGAEAARFLRWIATRLEQPLSLALEG